MNLHFNYNNEILNISVPIFFYFPLFEIADKKFGLIRKINIHQYIYVYINKYLGPFFLMLWVIIPGNVETDWVGLHLVIVDVVDSHCVEVLPPHQLSRQGNRCPHRRLHLKMQCSGSCILLKNVCKM